MEHEPGDGRQDASRVSVADAESTKTRLPLSSSLTDPWKTGFRSAPRSTSKSPTFPNSAGSCSARMEKNASKCAQRFRSQRKSLWSMPGRDSEDCAILLGEGAGSDVRLARCCATGKRTEGAATADGLLPKVAGEMGVLPGRENALVCKGLCVIEGLANCCDSNCPSGAREDDWPPPSRSLEELVSPQAGLASKEANQS
mmetsp:Transcript_78614/g.208725  ORF Transcript_78614/g.208725 Transcript_78614/m.208725 type:complete len:199 (-) Transcript_78614:166-762(-)